MIKQLDRLINIVGSIRKIFNAHGVNGRTGIEFKSENCHNTQSELSSLISLVDKMMAELSSDDANSHCMSEQFNIASLEELHRKQTFAPFNGTFQDKALLLQQHSSNGVVANNRQNQAVVAANPSGSSNIGPIKAHYGRAATSYGGVTSGDGLPITSGSNFLSPNTTPS